MPDPLDPRLARALDAFTVPELPTDFTDRVAARAAALAAEPPLPRRRVSAPRRWWRAGATGLATIAVGVVSISAAAMGYLGEPLSHVLHRTPVLGAALEHVLPERRPVHRLVVHRPVVLRPAPPAPALLPGSDQQPLADHPFARRAFARLRALPPEQRREWLDAHPRLAERLRERRAERHAARAGIVLPEEPGIVSRPLLRERLIERRERLRERWLARRAQGLVQP
ncbi:MAG: hypothetical protein KGM17_02095 [Sphingomonadales bacterium]|nr:hypothetical protein [Sphingomonadales bacterium]